MIRDATRVGGTGAYLVACATCIVLTSLGGCATRPRPVSVEVLPREARRLYNVTFAMVEGEPGQVEHELLIIAQREIQPSRDGSPVAVDGDLKVWRDGQELPVGWTTLISTDDGLMTLPRADAPLAEPFKAFVAHVAMGGIGDLRKSGTTWHRTATLRDGFVFDLEYRAGEAEAVASGQIMVLVRIEGKATSDRGENAVAVGEVMLDVTNPTDCLGWLHTRIEHAEGDPPTKPSLEQRASFVVGLDRGGRPQSTLERMRYFAAHLEFDPEKTALEGWHGLEMPETIEGISVTRNGMVEAAHDGERAPLPPLLRRISDALDPAAADLARCFAADWSGMVVFDLKPPTPRASFAYEFPLGRKVEPKQAPPAGAACAASILQDHLLSADRQQLGRIAVHVNPPPSVDDRGSPPSGALTKAQIKEVIDAHIGDVRACYEGALKGWPELVGKIAVTFVIMPDGAVATVRIVETSIRNPAVEACIARAMLGWRFPEPKGRGVVVITYPFILEQAR